MNLNNYSFEFTPAGISVGGTLLYIVNHPSYKCCNDLDIYKKDGLEINFTEIVNLKKSSVIVGVIYRHLYIDFNVKLLNYEHNKANKFYYSLACNSFLQLTRITSHSNTLIDSILLNVIDQT